MAIFVQGMSGSSAKRLAQIIGLVSVVFLASCNNTKLSKKDPEFINNETKFSSEEFGVDGSPRVTKKKQVRKGGGTYKVGKPYTIRGKTYYPKEDPNYSKTGFASWYGPNFHGRLTANGEIYDQFSLSAAHPTMPLPSYARVTNLENGSSVTVRVNDRGPYAHNRIIDLSARAAELLGYTRQGVAKVRVDYVGKARMDGLDEPYLVASYNPGSLDPGSIPSSGEGQVIVAGVKNGRQSLASYNSSVQTAYAGQVAPVPRFRPLTHKGIPMEIGVAQSQQPRPVLGLSGYVQPDSSLARIEAAFARFEKGANPFRNTDLLAEPDLGMKDLVRLRFGPFDTQDEIRKAENILTELGPVHAYATSGGLDNALVLVAARESLSSFISLPAVVALPVLD